jgi:hypothetical protein
MDRARAWDLAVMCTLPEKHQGFLEKLDDVTDDSPLPR